MDIIKIISDELHEHDCVNVRYISSKNSILVMGIKIFVFTRIKKIKRVLYTRR